MKSKTFTAIYIMTSGRGRGKAYKLGEVGFALVPLAAEPFSEGGADNFFAEEELRFWAILLRLGAGATFIFLSIYCTKRHKGFNKFKNGRKRFESI